MMSRCLRKNKRMLKSMIVLMLCVAVKMTLDGHI